MHSRGGEVATRETGIDEFEHGFRVDVRESEGRFLTEPRDKTVDLAKLQVLGPEGEDADCCRGYHHGDLRRCLLDAAFEVIRERGIAGTSLREIARRAGVSPRAPYHHFTDKLSLLAEVARTGFETLNASMREARVIEEPAERLLDLGYRYLRFAKENPGKFQAMHWAELCDEEHFADRQEVASAPFAYLLETIAAVSSRELAEQELEEQGTIAWAMVHGLAMLRADGALSAKRQDLDGEAAEEELLHRLLAKNCEMQVRYLRAC